MQIDLASSRRFIVVLGLLTGLVAFAIDISLPAIPDMVHDLATTMPIGQQVVGLFMAGMAVGQIPFGLFSDRIGRLPVLYAGIGLFTIAGLVTSLSQGIEIMLIARFAQGVGASAGMVLARAIVRDIASGDQAARLMTVMVMVFTAAPMLAPMVGSVLVTEWGWRGPFVATMVAGLCILYGINTSLSETGRPNRHPHIVRQLFASISEFLSHRRSIFGLLIMMAMITGIMALVSGSSALIIEIYGWPVQYFGFIFALTGVAILIGSSINRRMLQHFDAMRMIGLGAAIAGIAGAQLLYMAWLGQAPFWWLWGSACLFMCANAFLMANAMAIALEPVPEIAGVASSVIGTTQSLFGAISAVISSALYTGTIVNLTLVLGAAGVTVFVLYVGRHLIIGGKRSG